ncbi:MAG: uncharacterized protein K0S44_375 [Bacteroidetes bacterium]|jgi:hypothetical protein|nr:uncharacterized protein [Bacteroidota bacterium]
MDLTVRADAWHKKFFRQDISYLELYSLRKIKSFLISLLQLSALFYIIQSFQIEKFSGLSELAPYIIIAFTINSFMPLPFRPLVFLSLMVFVIYFAFGLFSGTTLLTISLTLVAVCHLSISFFFRISIILIIAAVLFILRSELFYAPRAALVVPFIASMFMFRLMIYLYEIKHKTIKPSFWTSLPYFFMYPNICFLFFPIVDYKTYVRTYNTAMDEHTWQKGIRWILRGIIHILCYRLIYYHFLPAPYEVHDLISFLQFTICTYALIIRISGLFHIIIGLLCIFGFNLPPAFNNYFLSENFIDLWKRINTYWREFILKVFFYPIFFKLKKKTPQYALPVTMMIIFALTWLLHDYQLFWLRGTFTSLSADITFWMVIGTCITINAVWIEKNSDKKSEKSELTSYTIRMIKITGIFLFMSVMWGMWTSESLSEWLYLVIQSSLFTWKELAFCILIYLLVIISGITIQFLLRKKLPARIIFMEPHKTLLLTFPYIILLTLLSCGPTARILPERVNAFVVSLSEEKPNRHDSEKKEQDYYVKLIDGEENRPSGLWEIPLKRQKNNSTLGEAYVRTDDILTKIIKPNVKVKNENYLFESNTFGLRDKEYTLAKPDSVWRIALLGGSYEMGSGVSNAEVFENIVETRYNANTEDKNIEILNFANGGFYLVQHVELCRTKVFRFSPDIVLYFAHSSEKDRMLICVASLIRQGKYLYYPFLEEIKAISGSKQSMSEDEIKLRLQPFADQLIKWSYMQIAEECKKNNAIPVWAYLPTIGDPENNEEYESILSYAKSLQFVTLDLRKVYRKTDENAIRISEWNSHPNTRGHMLIADIFYQELIKNKRYIFKHK